MRPDYRIGTHDAMLHRSEVHRPPLPAHQAIVATHQFAKHLFHRHAASQRMSMPAIRAKAEIARPHSLRAAGGNCLLTEGRSEEHKSELPSLMRTSYAVLCLKKQIQI